MDNVLGGVMRLDAEYLYHRQLYPNQQRKENNLIACVSTSVGCSYLIESSDMKKGLINQTF